MTLAASALAVLVVDDSRSARLVATRTLEKMGCRVVTAESGGAALQMLEQDQDISIVVTDMVMPAMSGVSLMQLVRQNYSTRGIRLIALTVEQDPASIETFLASGACAVLQKPLRASEFERVIRETVH